MAKRFFLRMLIRDEREDLIFEVRQADSDRLAELLSNQYEVGDVHFFWFEAVDGRSVIVNLVDLQAVRFLWEPSKGPSDLLRNEGAIQIKLRGRGKLLEEFTEAPEELFDLFTNLELGEGPPAFHSLVDVDGEPLVLNAREVVWIAAPQHLLDEGRQIVAKRADLDGEP